MGLWSKGIHRTSKGILRQDEIPEYVHQYPHSFQTFVRGFLKTNYPDEHLTCEYSIYKHLEQDMFNQEVYRIGVTFNIMGHELTYSHVYEDEDMYRFFTFTGWLILCEYEKTRDERLFDLKRKIDRNLGRYDFTKNVNDILNYDM